MASLSPKGKVSKFSYKFGGDREKSYAYSSTQLALMGRQEEIRYSIRESVLHINNDKGSNAYSYRQFRLKSEPENQYMSLTGKENGVLYRFTYSKVQSPEELALGRANAELAGTWLLVKVERMGEARNGVKMYMDDGQSSIRDHNHREKQKLTFSFNRDTNRGSYYRTLNNEKTKSPQHFVYKITSTPSVKSLILGSDDGYTYELFKDKERRDKKYMYLVKTMRVKGEEMNWTIRKLESVTITKQFRFTYEKIEE